jgi:hypothetical protein
MKNNEKARPEFKCCLEKKKVQCHIFFRFFLSPKLPGTPGIDFTESIPSNNQLRRAIDSREGQGEDPKTMSIPSLKSNFFWTWATRFHT